MKKAAVTILIILAPVAGAFASEWHYSDAMQTHIDNVNADLRWARLDAALSSGLMGSLQANDR